MVLCRFINIRRRNSLTPAEPKFARLTPVQMPSTGLASDRSASLTAETYSFIPAQMGIRNLRTVVLLCRRAAPEDQRTANKNAPLDRGWPRCELARMIA